jgi:ribonuclease BN (tRNA processing enzyme)
MLEPDRLSALLISHMHPDHFFDLVPLKYLLQFSAGRERPLPLYVPPGGTGVLCRLCDAVGLDGEFFSYFELAEYDPHAALQCGALSISFALTRHFIEGYAARFVSGDGGDLFYSSDTSWSESVIDFARGAAVALVEATRADAPPEEDNPGHLTPFLAGRLAADAGVSRLILTHFPQSLAGRTRAEGERGFGRAVEMAEPGRRYSIP